MTRVGVLGGTFDPIHSGHLIVAEEVRDVMDLDRVIFIPARRPPHKRSRSITSWEHRVSMLTRALAMHPGFEINPMELQRTGPSYTVDTLKTLNQQFDAENIYFIMGHDSFLEIETWHQYETLFTLCRMAVVTRPGTPPVDPDQFSPAVRRYFPDQVLKLDDPLHPDGVNRKSSWRICLMMIAGLRVSGSDIRKRVALGRSIRYLVPDTVRDYILDHRLYLDDPGGKEVHAHPTDE